MKAETNLERILKKGQFAVIGELAPPRGNDVAALRRKADLLRGVVDAIHVPDNPAAVVRLSSLAGSMLLLQMGFEPVMEMAARDRNRIALQSDLFGATALGIRNIFCLSGDHPSLGNQIESKNVYDLDSVQLIGCLENLRNHRTLLGGEEKAEGQFDLWIGALANPFGDPLELHVMQLAKKVRAGADFVQTLPIFDMDRFEAWWNLVQDKGLHEKVHIVAGIAPLKSVEMVPMMEKALPGVSIPKHLIDRMSKSNDPEREGIRIAVEQIQKLRKINGIHGVCLSVGDREEMVRPIAEGAGLLPRPKAE
jgi:methylenetetrahydrofolate reductase (NADPH)